MKGTDYVWYKNGAMWEPHTLEEYLREEQDKFLGKVRSDGKPW